MPDQSSLAFRIAAGRRMLYREGRDSNVGGHVSARADEGDGFRVTGFEYLDETLLANVAKLDFDLRPLVSQHVLSPAVNFHSLIYQLRADVNAIVHLYSRHTSVLSSTSTLSGCTTSLPCCPRTNR